MNKKQNPKSSLTLKGFCITHYALRLIIQHFEAMLVTSANTVKAAQGD